MTESEPSYVSWKGFLSVMSPAVIAAFMGVWALFGSLPEAPTIRDHDSAVRRIENLERRVDTIWQRPIHTTLTLDGEDIEGDVMLSPFADEIFYGDGIIARRSLGGKWQITWRRGDESRRNQKQ